MKRRSAVPAQLLGEPAHGGRAAGCASSIPGEMAASDGVAAGAAVELVVRCCAAWRLHAADVRGCVGTPVTVGSPPGWRAAAGRSQGRSRGYGETSHATAGTAWWLISPGIRGSEAGARGSYLAAERHSVVALAQVTAHGRPREELDSLRRSEVGEG